LMRSEISLIGATASTMVSGLFVPFAALRVFRSL
jgi:hypothetical protein